jgi:hypothetical protein
MKTRTRIPAYVKVPKFCTSKDIDKIMKMKELEPKRLWSEIIESVIEKRFEE